MSIQEIKAQFDTDYLAMRMRIVGGRMPLAQAREWVRLGGASTAAKMQKELNEHHHKFWGTRAGRDTETLFRELFGYRLTIEESDE